MAACYDRALLRFRLIVVSVVAVALVSCRNEATAPVEVGKVPASVAARGSKQPADFDVAGRNAATVLTRTGDAHVVYVDAGTRRLMHRRIGSPDATCISPAGDAVDLQGENIPLFTSRPDGALLVIYPAAISGGHGHHAKSELRAQLSRDSGVTWSPSVRVDGDTAPRSHNFADFAMAGDDAVVSWLDSRSGKQGVQTAVVRSDLRITDAQTADPLTCQCCRTALYTSSKGEIWLAYRDLADGNVRNMAYAVARGAGQPFESRGIVTDDRWSIKGCPESGPRFAETPDGTMWVAWFNGAANAIELASATPSTGFTSHGSVAEAANHPDIGTLPDGRLLLVYEAFRGDSRAVEARVSDAKHASWSNPIELAPSAESPHYVRSGDRALLSYTAQVNGVPHIRVIDPLPRIAQ
jgi:hypothetical protein